MTKGPEPPAHGAGELRKQRGPLARASAKRKSSSYLGADEDESPVDFFDFLLWCAFLCVELLAGADELLSEAGGVVSAASTGPASRSRLRTGTIFLNIELASETGWIHAPAGTSRSAAGGAYYDSIWGRGVSQIRVLCLDSDKYGITRS